MIGLSLIIFCSLQLTLIGCKDKKLTYIGNRPVGNPPDIAADLVYGYNLIHVGQEFPDTALKKSEDNKDNLLIGLGTSNTFSIRDIQAELVLVHLINIDCVPCQEQAPVYNDLFELINTDVSSKEQIKTLAVAVGNNKNEIKEFREEYKISFPVFADPRLDLHEAVGEPRLPFSILVRMKKSFDTAIVATTYSDDKKDYESLYQDIKALETLDLEVFKQRGDQSEAKAYTISPPFAQSEIISQIQKAMTNAGARSGLLKEFQRVPIKGYNVYSGIQESWAGKKRFFAEVVSSPTICDVCHDVHFFYIFNEKGQIIDFVPLQLTKWGNETWTEEDIKIMRERLKGRFIFTPFYFNPELDAVTSATITSVIIFDELSEGNKLFELLKQEGFVS